MEIDTTQLLNRLSQAKDIKTFLDENKNEFLTLSYLDFLNDIAAQKQMTLAAISKKSGQGDYVYKVFHGERKPSRDVLIAISIGMSLSINITQILLRISKLAALDPRDKRDSIILYALKENLTIEQLNDLLYELQWQTV